MTILVTLAAVVMILLAYGWHLTWLASRLDRAHRRIERSRAVLDAALTRRAHLVIALSPTTDTGERDAAPEIAAAMATLVATQQPDRERAESRLTRVLGASELAGLDDAQQQVVVTRRIHNDAVALARTVRRRWTVRVFRLAGHAVEPTSFEMADASLPQRVTRTDESSSSVPRVAA